MQINELVIGKIKIPLLQPYVSALRRVDAIEDIVIILKTNTGLIGYGAATATTAITGDSQESIVSAITNILWPNIRGKNLDEFDQLINIMTNSLEKNTSAKAAIDIALYDLQSKRCNLPLYKFLGGGISEIKTGMTIGLKKTEDMILEANTLISRGINHIKIKAGLDYQEDVLRIQAIRKVIGNNIELSIDANQAWGLKKTMQIIQMLEKLNVDVTIFEQPVKALDLDGLKFIREHTASLVFADEACFSIRDAIKIITENVADGLVIKLMKTGGLNIANTIYNIANSYNFSCMAGCMLESPITIGAMASFTSGKKIDFIDLGTLARLKNNPITGGIKLEGTKLILADNPGLGIETLGEIEILYHNKLEN